MSYTLSLGTLGSPPPKRAGGGKDVFRLAVLADFWGRASPRRPRRTGDNLASRKPITVDVDNLDAVVKRLGINLTLPIARKMPPSKFPSLRWMIFIRIKSSTTSNSLAESPPFANVLKAAPPSPKPPQKSKAGSAWSRNPPHPNASPLRGAVIPVGGKLSDFACLMGQSSAPAAEASVNGPVRTRRRPARGSRQNTSRTNCLLP